MKNNILLITLLSIPALFGENDDLAKKVEIKAMTNLLLGLQLHLPSGTVEKAKIDAALYALNSNDGFYYQSEIAAYKAAVLELVKKTILKI
jgi:hypothetical protein